MYLKFNKLGVFEELKKKKPINYDDVSINLKLRKRRWVIVSGQCAAVLNVSIATITRIASGKIKGFPALYERLRELNII